MTVFLAALAILAPQPQERSTQQVAVHNESLAVVRQQYDPRRAVVRPYWSRFMRIARCESGSRWHIATGNGFYGGIQFTKRSWRLVGGRGLPNWYSKLEQVYRGVLLMLVQGWNAWPVCAYR